MFLTIKKIPKNYWSSEKPLNLKPKSLTVFYLTLGLTIFGLGEGLLIVSYSGASPWSVLAQGISLNIDLSIGLVTFIVSVCTLSLWFFLKQKPGIGTVFNIIIIAAMIDLTIFLFVTPETYLGKLLMAVFAVLLVGLGSGFYLIANLGPGPRDGLMTGIQRITNFPIAAVRAGIEITVVSIGWYLGGTVGVGTLLFAFGIGPAVASLCSPVETKPAIVIIDGEQRRKAKKWASSDIVTFAACYLHVERSPRQASAQQSVWVQSTGFRSQQTTHQPYHVCNSPGKLLRTRRQSQHCQSSRNNCSASAML